MQLGNYFPLAALATLPAVLPLAFGAARPVRQEAETAPLRSRPARAVEARDLAELLPARTLLYVESATGAQLFERGLEHPLVGAADQSQ